MRRGRFDLTLGCPQGGVPRPRMTRSLLASQPSETPSKGLKSMGLPADAGPLAAWWVERHSRNASYGIYLTTPGRVLYFGRR